jgi:TonB family protein
MRGLRDTEEPDRLSDSGSPYKSGLLRMGIASALLHIGLIVSLSLGLGPVISKGGSSVYRVTLLPFSPPDTEIPDTKTGPDLHRSLPAPSHPLSKSQTQEEEKKPNREIKRGEPAIDEKRDLEILAPVQPVRAEAPMEEPKPLPQRREGETVIEPIPLPMAAAAPLDAEPDPKEDPPVVSVPSRLVEGNDKAFPGSGSIEIAFQGGLGWGGPGHGTGSGRGGPGRGSPGEGQGAGKGGFGRGGLGEGPRAGSGGPGKGAGPGQGGSGWGAGWGAGDGSGPGRGDLAGGAGGGRGAGLARPRYAENPRPVYPSEAREKGYQGQVILRVEVLADGRVGQIEMKKSSGHEVLDRSALTTVKKWRFIPARREGVAVPFWVNVPVEFQLL